MLNSAAGTSTAADDKTCSETTAAKSDELTAKSWQHKIPQRETAAMQFFNLPGGVDVFSQLQESLRRQSELKPLEEGCCWSWLSTCNFGDRLRKQG
jgi:hypothetical protein